MPPLSITDTAAGRARMSFALVRGLTFRYALSGPEGAEPLVFIHALGCDLHIWDAVSAAFVSNHRVLCYDLRGHGHSDTCGTESTIEDHADDLAALLDHAGLGPATLAGISLGGVVALATTARYPVRVRRLLLCATGARIGTAASWNERMQAVRAGGLEHLADGILARWFLPGFSSRAPAVVRGFRNILTRTPAAGYLAACAALRDADLNSVLPSLRIPALVVTGGHDVATPPALGRALAEQLPRARFASVRDAAHLPPVEQPAALVTLLSDFLHEPCAT